MAAIVRETIQPYELAAVEQDSGTRFELSVAPGLPRARGDVSQIRRVIEHLIDNGAKYAAGGHVKAALTPVEGGGGVRLDVCDDGPGIRPEDVDRVFAPFGRGRNAGDKSGYGLGLYLARNIARAHGGRLWIARTSRSGTCMALTLPGAVNEEAGAAEA
jgi:signal transduction histidine kinase